ncbi:MAG: hypothetical protein CMJ46_01495 [Planctomyces sp.]|nr:hypothetical protein [Planctomyces sp.]
MHQNPDKPLGPRHVPDLDLTDLSPDADRGERLYVEKCADCHGTEGTGTDLGPPVWGNDSFNNGAGLSRNDKLANWIKVAMPLDDATLTAQEAYDLAAFVNQHDRPVFRLKDHLPPPAKQGVYNGKTE